MAIMRTALFFILSIVSSTFTAVFPVAGFGQVSVNATSTAVDILVRNGLKAKRAEYREAVVIELEPRGFCSGVLLRKDVVLSAAHCLTKGRRPVRVTAGLSVRDSLPISRNAGYARIPMDMTQSPVVQTIAVEHVIPMDKAALESNKDLDGRDLMLVFLQKSFSPPVMPISIPSLANLAEVKNVRIVGFGEDGSKNTGNKLFADVDVRVTRCNPTASSGPESYCHHDAEMFTQDGKEQFDACPGDSGGPVYARHVGGQYKLIGVTSRTPMKSMECRGGVFVTLLDGDRLKWIHSHGVALESPSGDLRWQAVPIASPPTCVPPSCYIK